MAQDAKNTIHAAQIEAGTSGRHKGHLFEKTLSEELSNIKISEDLLNTVSGHLFVGLPSRNLIHYILSNKKIRNVRKIKSYWLGGLATSGEGDKLFAIDKKLVGKSKSDVVIDIETDKEHFLIGVSVKTCNKNKPTNDQIFFTTASAFCRLLRENEIPVSQEAENGLKMFCGDLGWRPVDQDSQIFQKRKSDPERWYFEELSLVAQKEWRSILTESQKQVTTVLLQKAYLDDPIPPEFLLHQTVYCADISQCETAIFSIDELTDLSRRFAGFETPQYFVKKGRFKGDPNPHSAPRFGYIQFQRGGQKQHPTQLQFNLQAGYFYKLPQP
jgi:hypothetical protein